MTAPDDCACPRWNRSQCRQRIAESRLGYPGMTGLDGQASWGASGRVRRMDFALPPASLQGDAKNRQRTRDDHGTIRHRPRRRRRRPPQIWDSSKRPSTMTRFGWHTARRIRDFHACIGYDLLQWPGYQVLALSDEYMVTWMVLKAMERHTSAEERKRASRAAYRGQS